MNISEPVFQPAAAPRPAAPVAALPAAQAAAPAEFPDQLPRAGLIETFDGRLGIPVLEVINAKGDIEQSYPSQKQLHAYATAAAPGPHAPAAAKLSSTA